jgi:hypothetical protein
MSDTAWIGTPPPSAGYSMPFTNSFVGTERQRDGAIWGEKNNYGDALPAECFPAEIFATEDAKDHHYKLPDLFSDANFWVVSQNAANVLWQFDLGDGALYAVKVLKSDRKTPVDGEWFCLNFGNRKSALLVEQSARMNETYVQGGVKGWSPRATMKDGDVAISKAALAGPDIWVEPILAYSFFLSGPLGRALKKAKADKGFFLHKVKVI